MLTRAKVVIPFSQDVTVAPYIDTILIFVIIWLTFFPCKVACLEKRLKADKDRWDQLLKNASSHIL